MLPFFLLILLHCSLIDCAQSPQQPLQPLFPTPQSSLPPVSPAITPTSVLTPISIASSPSPEKHKAKGRQTRQRSPYTRTQKVFNFSASRSAKQNHCDCKEELAKLHESINLLHIKLNISSLQNQSILDALHAMDKGSKHNFGLLGKMFIKNTQLQIVQHNLVSQLIMQRTAGALQSIPRQASPSMSQASQVAMETDSKTRTVTPALPQQAQALAHLLNADAVPPDMKKAYNSMQFLLMQTIVSPLGQASLLTPASASATRAQLSSDAATIPVLAPSPAKLSMQPAVRPALLADACIAHSLAFTADQSPSNPLISPGGPSQNPTPVPAEPDNSDSLSRPQASGTQHLSGLGIDTDLQSFMPRCNFTEKETKAFLDSTKATLMFPPSDSFDD